MSKRIKATFSEGAFQTDEQFVEGQDYWLKVSPAPKEITGGESSDVDGSFSTVVGGDSSEPVSEFKKLFNELIIALDAEEKPIDRVDFYLKVRPEVVESKLGEVIDGLEDAGYLEINDDDELTITELGRTYVGDQ